MCPVINPLSPPFPPLSPPLSPPLQRKKVTFTNFKPVFQVILRTFNLEIYSQTLLKVAFVMSSLIFKARKLDLHET